MDPNSSISGKYRRRAVGLVVMTGLVVGCSSPGPLSRRLTTVDSLKTDVAQLETEKAQLRREVSESQKENRRIAAQLSEAEDENSELATRLNDARAVISRQGLDSDKFAPPSRTAESDRFGARKSAPAASKSRGRKAPMAEIRGDRRPAIPNRDDLPLDEGIDAPGPSRRDNDPFGSQGSNLDNSPWLPVAKGSSENGRTVR